MYNLGDDNELDRISREAAGRYTPPGQANWDQLSAELDRIMPEEKKKRRFLFWWLFPALLAGGAAVYSVWQSENSKPVAKNTPETLSEIKSDASGKTLPPATGSAAENNTKSSDKSESTQPETVAVLHNGQETVTVENISKKKASSVQTKNRLSATTKQTKENNQNINNSNKGSSLQNSIADPAYLTNSGLPKTASIDFPANGHIGSLVNEQKTVTKETETVETPQTKPEQSAIKPDTNPAAVTESAAEEKNAAKELLPKRGKGWSYALLAGVDKSTVKFTYGYTPGINLGLMIGYHFNDKWAIQTGAIYTRKNYKMAGEDFTAPKGSWVSYYKLDQVEGSCRMWEIPLLVSYTLHSSNRKSVTLNTGLSSYFMTREDYDYYYYFNNNPTSRSATYNSTDQHILAIAHLSAGFENRISRNMSVIVEPYAKIPMGGVGFGSIKLSSFGLNFSVQMRQPAKK